MKVYLGIDGGGTGTKFCLINDNDEVILFEDGDRTSIDTISFEESFNNINEVLKKFDFTNYKLESIFAGIGGIVSNNDKKQLATLLKKANGVTKDTIINVENDVINALASGLILGDGMTLIVGTGMAAFGVNGERNHKSGGWGYKEGDAGSGYDLGFQAVKIAVRASDFRIKKTAFTNEISNAIGLRESTDIIKIMDELHMNRTKMASLAPIVTKHGNRGDIYAIKIIEVATDELAMAVRAVYQTLKFNDVQLVIVGSLGNADGIFKELLHNKIKAINAKIEIISPKVDPAIAAAMLAKRKK